MIEPYVDERLRGRPCWLEVGGEGCLVGGKFFMETPSPIPEPGWWAGNSGAWAMMLSPCPIMGHVVWRVFLSARTVLQVLPEKRTIAVGTTTRIQAQRKGRSRPAPRGPGCARVKTQVAWAGRRDLAVCGWRGA